ncbi:MAG TPA: NosD domain-containing protein [Lysobacter sp.]
MTNWVPVLLFAVAAGCFVPGKARAAEDYDNCTGYIDSLPASISTQGTWCLRKHLFTSMSSGAAITIATDNVTVDCNHFRLSGFGAGIATSAMGIATGTSRQNATIRRCRIQGFSYGVSLSGANHVIERSQLDRNNYAGIFLDSDGSAVRDNIITGTGGYPGGSQAFGIYAISSGTGAQIIGNTIRGIAPAGDVSGNRNSIGIHAGNALIQGNRIGGLVAGGSFVAIGIAPVGGLVRDNVVMQLSSTPGYGVSASGGSICQDNTVKGYVTAIANCFLAGANGEQP